jgi:hypothetical protein
MDVAGGGGHLFIFAVQLENIFGCGCTGDQLSH